MPAGGAVGISVIDGVAVGTCGVDDGISVTGGEVGTVLSEETEDEEESASDGRGSVSFSFRSMRISRTVALRIAPTRTASMMIDLFGRGNAAPRAIRSVTGRYSSRSMNPRSCF